MGADTASPMSVTAPTCASSWPFTTAPAFTDIDAYARTAPTKFELAPIVAEEPTTQNTLHACTPPVSTTLDPLARMSVETIWKTKTELGEPVSVSVPVMPRLELDA